MLPWHQRRAKYPTNASIHKIIYIFCSLPTFCNVRWDRHSSMIQLKFNQMLKCHLLGTKPLLETFADLVPQKHISVKTESKYNIFFIQGNVFDNVCIMSDVEFQPPCIKHLMTPNIFQEMPCQSQRQLKRRVELLTRLNVVQLVFNSGGLWQLVFQDFSNSSTYQWKGWLSLR